MILDHTILRRLTPISLAMAARLFPERVQAHPYLPGEPVTVPQISCGVTGLEGLTLRQSPPDGANTTVYNAAPIDRYVVFGATVHSRLGFVTCGDLLFSDFLEHVPLHDMPGAGPAQDGGWMFADVTPQMRLAHGVHLMTTNLDNYYHWTIDLLSRFDATLCRPQPPLPRPVLIVSAPRAGWQVESLALLDLGDTPVITLDHGAVATVSRLVVVPGLAGGGFFPTPLLLRNFLAWRTRLARGTDGPRRLYISRRDSDQRRLVNEDAVIDVVRRAGYTVVTLSGMSVVEQIRLFAGAERIVAPHGAGLTNIVYCGEGTSLLELHMDGYVQWAFRRLAGIAGLRYGCVIGQTCEPWHDWPHVNTWRIDPDAVAAALAAM